jgi:hypothetical protein
VLNKRIEIAWLTRLNNILNLSLGTSALAITIVCLECMAGLSWMLHNHVGIELQVWLVFIEFAAPFLCLFLVGLLVVAYFRNHRRETAVFLVGLVTGMIPIVCFVLWAANH